MSQVNVKTKPYDEQLKAKIITWARAIRSWRIQWCTGIYPGEMAAFLGLCDLNGVRSIVESGRGEDAYSTQVLGAYGEQTGVKVVSIDVDPVRGRPFQRRLEGYRNLTCVAGNTFDVLPDAIRKLPSPIGMLLDGPKLQPANRLSLVASVMFDIRVVAHHNCPLSAPWGQEFARVFPSAFHYEQLDLSAFPEWQDFKLWEREWVHDYEVYGEEHGIPGRLLQASSLALAHASPHLRSSKRLLKLQKGSLRYNPLMLRLAWSLFRIPLALTMWLWLKKSTLKFRLMLSGRPSR